MENKSHVPNHQPVIHYYTTKKWGWWLLRIPHHSESMQLHRAKLHCQHAWISARRTTRNPPTNSSAGYTTRAQILQEELRNLESSWFCRLIGGFRLKSHQIQLHTWNCSKTLNHKPAFQLSQRFEKGGFGARLGFTWRIISRIVAKKHGEEVPEVGGFLVIGQFEVGLSVPIRVLIQVVFPHFHPPPTSPFSAAVIFSRLPTSRLWKSAKISPKDQRKSQCFLFQTLSDDSDYTI